MDIWFWFVLAIIIFAFITFIRKWYDHAMLYTIAIGFAINANIFNAMTAPVYCGPLTFSIDSILYTGFMFCVIVCAIEYGVREAKILTSSAIAAILLSALIEFLAKISSIGYQTAFIMNFFGYFFSAVGTFAGVWLMLFIFEKLKKRGVNNYINISLGILIASIVNTSIYYIFTIITTKSVNNLGYMLAGSYIGKVFCILLCLCSFFVSTRLFIPNNLKEKYAKTSQKKDEKIQQKNLDAK